MALLKLENITPSKIATDIFEKAQKSLGFVPNMYQKMGANAALIDSYTYAYNSFRAHAGFTPAEQEVVFLSVAYENNCDYCMAAHSFVGDKMTHVPTEVTDAIRDDREVPDPKLNALSKLTRLLTVNRGHATREEIDQFLAAGYSESHVLGIIVGIGVKTLSNYQNHLTSPEVDAVFHDRLWKKH